MENKKKVFEILLKGLKSGLSHFMCNILMLENVDCNFLYESGISEEWLNRGYYIPEYPSKPWEFKKGDPDSVTFDYKKVVKEKISVIKKLLKELEDEK